MVIKYVQEGAGGKTFWRGGRLQGRGRMIALIAAAIDL